MRHGESRPRFDSGVDRDEGRYPLGEKFCAPLVHLVDPKLRLYLVDEFDALVNVHDGGGGFGCRAYGRVPFGSMFAENDLVERGSEESLEFITGEGKARRSGVCTGFARPAEKGGTPKE